MESSIHESDWKLFRKLQTLALERFCQRVLDAVGQLISNMDETSHARYLALYRLLKERDKHLADGFNDPRRSIALIQLARIREPGQLTDVEFARFSDEARTGVQDLLDIWRDQ
jgi:hypothetical protein